MAILSERIFKLGVLNPYLLTITDSKSGVSSYKVGPITITMIQCIIAHAVMIYIEPCMGFVILHLIYSDFIA